MAHTVLPASLLHELAELRRRIGVLENSPRAPHTSVENGTFAILDSDGNTLVELGAYDAGGASRVGLRITHPSTGIGIFEADAEQGLVVPYQSLQLYDSRAGWAVTSASFTPTWARIAEQISGDAIKFRVPYVTGAATTGELRVAILGVDTTDAIVLPAASGGFLEFNWLHGQIIGSGPVQFYVEARRTGGAGDVAVFPPTAVLGGSAAFGATASGV